MSILDKRKVARFPFNVNVKYKKLNTSTTKNEEARVKNLSVGGICLLVNKKPDVGSLLKLTFSRPGDNGSFIVKGRVVWARESSDEKACDCGIAFVDAEDQRSIVDYLTAPSKSKSYELWKSDLDNLIDCFTKS
jgi:hypothetical protein